ncbi:malonyl CoA-acyl carrier protein transacylase [Paractinoplanes abujensis]|uniref:[acyl-carrier-protein] S-malonyltransferase n=1 Tax=Paractinoplanes abujensis TaxID=882441 RepID=A0A7W7CK15_9ACTN|nr:ACP S-malonyltransferase [Actinoplanes abujensis]MBB4689953.1 [acyl-carrier-protein] S-malonyltransferase [Actinoplanes abujensis]GID24640.1 malonyl CoA-acyl carrier protein transacylase [Actinoplanes abujensis]
MSALIFPGIGPMRLDDSARYLTTHPVARGLVAEADQVLGYPLIDRYREAESRGDEGAFPEPARITFLTGCVALARGVTEDGEPPVAYAGASLGGVAAAVQAGALSFADAVRLTAEWGRRANAYFAREHRDIVTQSFARVPADRLAEIRAELDARGEWNEVSCQVDHDFYLLSIREHGLDQLQRRLRAAGGLPLYVMRPPMHSPAFQAFRDEMAAEPVAGLTFTDPHTPVVSDHDGSLVTTADGIRTLLLDAATRPVRWPAVVDTLRGLGVRRVIVAGQDRLWGRVEIMTNAFEVVAVKPDTAMRPRRRSVIA